MLFRSGTVTGGGAMAFAGRLDWGNGVMRNLTATFNGAPSFVAGSVPNVLDNATLNFGGGVVDSSVGVTLQTGATINISAGYEIRSGHDFTAGTGGGFLKVLAGGTLTNNVGTDVNIIGPGVVLTNNGTVNAASANFDIRGGSNGTGGTWGAILGNKILFNAGTHTLGGTTTFAEGGGGEMQVLTGATVNLTGPTNLNNAVMLSVNGGTVNAANALTVGATATLNLDAGTLTGSGALTVNGTLNWTGGTMSGAGTTTITSGAVLNIGGAVAKTLNRQLLNNGTANWVGSAVGGGRDRKSVV